MVINADRKPDNELEGCYNPAMVNEVALVIVGK